MASKTLYIGIAAVVVVLAAIAALLATGGQQPEPTPPPTATTPTPTAPPTTTQKKTVYIGAALPFTGGLQSYGISVKNAVELAVEDANNMCPNFEFKLLVEDTGTDPTQALQKIQTLYAKGAKLIVGPMSSREVSAVKSFADMNKILIFSPSSTSPLLAIPDDWIFRMVSPDSAQAVAIADLLKHLGIKRAVILYRNDAWGLGLNNAIINETKKLGIQIVASEGYDPDPRAFPTAVPEAIRRLSARLGQPGPDAAIIFAVFADDGLIAMQAAAQDPVLSKVRWIGTDGIAYSSDLIKQVGKEMAAGKMARHYHCAARPQRPQVSTV